MQEFNGVPGWISVGLFVYLDIELTCSLRKRTGSVLPPLCLAAFKNWFWAAYRFMGVIWKRQSGKRGGEIVRIHLGSASKTEFFEWISEWEDDFSWDFNFHLPPQSPQSSITTWETFWKLEIGFVTCLWTSWAGWGCPPLPDRPRIGRRPGWGKNKRHHWNGSLRDLECLVARCASRGETCVQGRRKGNFLPRPLSYVVMAHRWLHGAKKFVP